MASVRKKSKVKRKFFVSYAVIFIVMISIVMSLYYFFYAKVLTQNERKVQEVVAAQMAGNIQQHFDNLPQVVLQFYYSPWVRRIMYIQKDPDSFGDLITPIDIHEYSKQILLTETTGSYGERIAIYFSLADKVVSDVGELSWRDYADMYSLSSERTSLVDGSIFQQNNQHLIISSCRMKMDAVMNDCLAYIQTIPMESYQGSHAAVVFFIPLNRIAETSYSYYHNKDISISLLHEGSDMITLGGREKPKINAETLANLENENLANRLQYVPEIDAYVIYQKLSGTDLASIVSIPAADIRAGAVQIRQIFLALFVMMLAFILLISYKMSNSYYRPIEKIVTNISLDLKDRNPQSDLSVNEYGLIESALQSLSSQNEELNTVIFKQNPVIRRYAVQKLLEKGRTMPDDEMFVYLEEFNRYSLTNCIVMKKSAHYYQAKEEIIGCLESSVSLVYLDVEHQDKLIIIVNYDAAETLEIMLEWVQQVFTDLGITNCYLGIGRETENVLDIHDAYADACAASDYGYFYKDGYLLYAEALSGRENYKPSLRANEERRLIQSLSQGQTEDVMAAYENILDEHLDEISLDNLVAFIDLLNGRISSHLKSQYPGLPFNMSLNPKTFPNLEQYLSAFQYNIKKVFQSLNVSKPGANMVNKAIIEFVQEHLSDPDLSLKMLADFLGYTQTYLSRYFKEQFQCNYHEYVVKKRLMVAMDALSNSQRSINEIAAMSGFASDATFRRMFKNQIGLTPVQYRRQALVNRQQMG